MAKLKDKVQKLEQQAKVIDYYCSVEENGIKVSELERKLAKVELSYERLKKQYIKETDALKKKVQASQNQLNSTLTKLKILYQDHYKPLVKENEVQDQIIEKN